MDALTAQPIYHEPQHWQENPIASTKRQREDTGGYPPSECSSSPPLTPSEVYSGLVAKRVRYDLEQWPTALENGTSMAVDPTSQPKTWATFPSQILHHTFQFLATGANEGELYPDLVACSLVCKAWHDTAFPEFVLPHLLYLRLDKNFSPAYIPRLESLLLESLSLGLAYPSYIQGLDLHPSTLIDVTNLLKNFDPAKPPPTMPKDSNWVDLDIYLERLRPDPIVHGLARVLDLASPLRRLRLHDVYNKQSCGWHLLRPFFARLASRCADLREFTLYESAFSDTPWDHCLTEFISSLGMLEAVYLNDCRNDPALFAALARLPAISTAVFANMDWIADGGVAAMVGAWHSLRVLIIDGGLVVTPELVRVVAERCSVLEELVLKRDEEDYDDERPGSACRKKKDKIMANLAARMAGTGGKKRNVHAAAATNNDDQSGKTTLQMALFAVLNRCPNLTRLELDLPPRISRPLTNDLLYEILSRPRRLRRLSLLFLKFITGKCVNPTSIPPGLEALDVRGCDNLLPSCVEAMLENCPRLQELDLPASFTHTREGRRVLTRIAAEFGFKLDGGDGRRTGVWRRMVLMDDSADEDGFVDGGR